MGRLPLIGRDDVVADAVRALNGRGVVIAGPPGSGRTRVLEECRARAPATGVVVTDDLDRIGEAAAASLRETIAAGNARILGVVTSGRACPDAVMRLWRDHGVRRLDLAPLDRAAVGALAEIAVAAPLDGSAIHRLSTLCPASVRDLTDLLDALVAEEWFDRRHGIARLQPGLPYEALRGRIAARDDLGERARRLVEEVAIAGALPASVAATGWRAQAAPDAIASGLVVVGPDGTLRPTSPLIAELIRASLTNDERVGHRAALVAELEGRVTPDPEWRRVRAVAYADAKFPTPAHVVEGRAVIAEALDAGRADVVDLAESLWQATADPEDGLALALAYDHTGRFHEQLAVAGDLVRGATDDRVLAIAVDRMVSALVRLGRDEEAIEAVAAARARVTDPVATVRLQIVLANRQLHDGRLRDALALTEPLLDLGVPVPEGALIAAVAHAVAGDLPAALARADQGEGMVATGAEAGELAVPLLRVARALAFTQVGRLDEAEEAIHHAYEAAIAAGDRPRQGWTSLTLGRIELNRGRTTRAVRYFNQSLVGFGEQGEVGYVAWARAGLAASLALAGDLPAAQAALARRERFPGDALGLLEPESQRLLAAVEVAGGDVEAAIGRLQRAIAAAGEQETCRVALLHDLARCGDRTACDPPGDGLAAVYRAHARALAGGDAGALADVAESHMRRGAWRDAAQTFAEAAAAATHERDVTAWRRRAFAAEVRCEHVPPPPVHLSARQHDVAVLAAAGLARPAIAEQLFLSDRTVDRHLGDIFKALGIRRQDELAAALDDIRGAVADPGTPPASLDRWPLVGRTDEANALRRAIADPRVRAAVLRGPLGCGTSTLAFEMQSELAGRGWVAVTVRPTTPWPVAMGALETAETRPVALVVDDAHLLTRSQAAHLRATAGGLRGFTVVTVSGPSLAEWVGDDIEEITLAPLGEAAVDELLHRALDGPTLGTARAALHEASGGNPLLLRELVRESLRSGRLVCRDGVWTLDGSIPVAPGLRDLVASELRAVSLETREVIDALATLGPAPRALLHAMTTATAIAAAVELGLVRDEGEDVLLAHPAFGDQATLRDTEDIARDALDHAARLGLPLGASRLANWSLIARRELPVAAWDRATREMLDAGDQTEALRFAQEIVRADPTSDAALLMGNALATAGATADADRFFAGLGHPPAAIARSDLALWRDADPERAAQLVTGVDGEDASDQRALARVFGRVASPSEFTRPDSARSLLVASAAALTSGLPDRAADLAAQASAVLDDWGETMYLAAAVKSQWAHSLMHAGRLDDVEAVLRPRGRLTRPGPDQAWLELARGRVQPAQLLFHDGLGHPMASPRGELWCSLHIGLALAATWCGDAATARSHLRQVARPPMTAEFRAYMWRADAWALAVDGDRSAAIAGLVEAADRCERWPTFAAVMLHDAVRLGDVRQAGRLRVVAAAMDGPQAAARTRLATGIEQHDPGVVFQAAELFAVCGMLLLAAETGALAARWSGAAAHRASARRWLDGCPGAQTPGAHVGRGALTTRQRDIARLAVTGQSSKEIADRLGLSVRTVDNHLQRIYDRLGVRRREDLAAALA